MSVSEAGIFRKGISGSLQKIAFLRYNMTCIPGTHRKQFYLKLHRVGKANSLYKSERSQTSQTIFNKFCRRTQCLLHQKLSEKELRKQIQSYGCWIRCQCCKYQFYCICCDYKLQTQLQLCNMIIDLFSVYVLNAMQWPKPLFLI